MFQYQLLTHPEEILNILSQVNGQEVGFDIETESLEPRSKIAGFSLYIPSLDSAYYIPFYHPGVTHPHGLITQIGEMVSNFKVITYNGGFDTLRWEVHFGKAPQVVGDADIAAKMLQLHKFGLKPMSLEFGIASEVISLDSLIQNGDYNFCKLPLSDQVVKYAAQDAYLAYHLEKKLTLQVNPLHHPGWYTVYPLELEVQGILAKASYLGMRVDPAQFIQSCREMATELQTLSKDICTQLNRNPDTFAINSPKQLAAALFRAPNAQPTGKEKTTAQKQMALPGLGLSSPTDNWSTATSTLSLIEDEHPVIPMLLRWKTLNAIVTRDVPQLEKHASTGRINTNFVQIGEDGTSRIYTKDPNLISLSMSARKAIKPEPGRCFLHVDYKAAEWYLGGLLSGEQKILSAKAQGIDPHKYTYNQMTGVPVDQITHDQRETGKILNYATFYGAESYRIALSLGCSQEQAQKFLDDFWNAYPHLAAWIKMRKAYAAQHGRTFTILGRSRDLRGDIFVSNPQLKKKGLRKAVNTAGQGSCGDVTKMALRNIARLIQEPNHPLNLANVQIKCPVFDAILLEMDEKAMTPEFKSGIEQALKDAMGVKLEYEGRSMRMLVSMGWSQNSWAEACGKG